ncbi:MAG: DUF4097 family beta strand repeat-containing protein [Planctomycetota bacterium]|jgi:hypothetical protein
MRSRPIAALVCLAACLLAGCSRRTVTDQPWTLDVRGPVAIDVQLFAGDVSIVADPRLTQAAVRVERESTHGVDRAEEAESSLEQIGYSVEMVPGPIGQVLQIRAATQDAEPHFQRVNLTIDLPAAENITIHTSRGRVTARNVSGAIDIKTSNDDVLVVTELPLVEPVTIVNQYGNIDLRCRGESRGELDLQTVGGRVFQKIGFGETVIHPGTQHDTLLASFNGGSNPMRLRTVEGDIRFVVEANPAAFGHFIFP